MFARKQLTIRQRIVRLIVALVIVGIAYQVTNEFKARKVTKESLMFQNPVLAGFYPDPSICRAGNDYYLVNSTFSYFPGVPVFHSTDLVNWTQLGYILDRPEQLNLDGLGVSRGVFAPAISHHDSTFYMVTTLVDAGGNMVVTAKNPAGPWSNPVFLPDVQGIDPSLFFDDNGKCFIIYNGEPPENKSLYNGHRALWMYEMDIQNLKTVGEKHLIVSGGTDISKNPIWIEGPHIFKKDGYYYLIAAEGGTSFDHSEVVFRAKEITGPYENYSGNPILTQRHLDPKREHPVTCTGHADFVETQNGEWWAVFLGVRTYYQNHFNTGRETFMAPVRWVDGWPVIASGNELVQYSYPVPDLPAAPPAPVPLNSNFTMKDDFDSEQLSPIWMFLRTVRKDWYSLTRKKGLLCIQLRPEKISGSGNPSFIGRRQQHLNCKAIAAMNFTPEAKNETAGLIIFQNETHYYYLGKTVENGKPVVQVKNNSEVLAQKELTEDESAELLYLKIEARGKFYNFAYTTSPIKWTALQDSVDATQLSTEVAGGFVGCFFGMYASSQGAPSENCAEFDWFEYSGDDPTFAKK